MFKNLDYQVDLAKRIVGQLEKNDIVVCSIPCGYGKTGIAYQVHKLYGERSLILNHNRILVDQYENLYTGLDGVCCIKGKSNYICPISPSSQTVEDSPCQVSKKYKCFKRNKGECHYYKLREEFDESPLSVTNYQLALSLLDIGHYTRENNSLLICDECHNLDNILCSYRTVRINQNTLSNIEKAVSLMGKIGYDKSELFDECEEIYENITESNYRIQFQRFFNNARSIEEAGSFIVSKYSDKVMKTSEQNLIFSLSQVMSVLHKSICKYNNYESDNYESNYVFQSEEGEYTLIPVYVGNFFTMFTRSLGKKIVLMSGTLVNKENMAKNIGFSRMKTSYIDIPSMFPKEHRPIILVNSAKLNMKTAVPGTVEFKNTIQDIKTIVRRHFEVGESGVIFVSSYILGKYIYQEIESFLKNLNSTVIMNTGPDDTADTLQKFCDTSVKRRLLISPSFEEGVNFTGDISRFQIIVKVPYLNLGNKRIQIKMQRDKAWYETMTFTRIMQSSARSVRNKDDYAYTYVLDRNGSLIFSRMREHCPQWFTEAVRTVG